MWAGARQVISIGYDGMERIKLQLSWLGTVLASAFKRRGSRAAEIGNIPFFGLCFDVRTKV